MRLCSACLMGINCTHDATNNLNEAIFNLARKEALIPVCPEQLGGLPTPREPSEQKGGRVITESGKDVTENFVKGATEVLKIARLFGIKKAILKQRSPSCGCGQIYEGTFSGTIVPGDGITTALLKKEGIEVISEGLV